MTLYQHRSMKLVVLLLPAHICYIQQQESMQRSVTVWLLKSKLCKCESGFLPDKRGGRWLRSRAQLSVVSHPVCEHGFSYTELPPHGTSAQMAFRASLSSISMARLCISCTFYTPSLYQPTAERFQSIQNRRSEFRKADCCIAHTCEGIWRHSVWNTGYCLEVSLHFLFSRWLTTALSVWNQKNCILKNGEYFKFETTPLDD